MHNLAHLCQNDPMDTNDGRLTTGFVMHERLLIARTTGRLSELNDQEFAAKIGISRGALASYEKGKTTPKLPVLESYANKTGYTLEWLQAGRAWEGGSHPELAGVVMSTDPVRVLHPNDIPVRT